MKSPCNNMKLYTIDCRCMPIFPLSGNIANPGRNFPLPIRKQIRDKSQYIQRPVMARRPIELSENLLMTQRQ